MAECGPVGLPAQFLAPLKDWLRGGVRAGGASRAVPRAPEGPVVWRSAGWWGFSRSSPRPWRCALRARPPGESAAQPQAFRGAGNCATSPHWPVPGGAPAWAGRSRPVGGAGNCATSPHWPVPGEVPAWAGRSRPVGGAGNCARSPHWPVPGGAPAWAGRSRLVRGAGNCARSSTGPHPATQPHRADAVDQPHRPAGEEVTRDPLTRREPVRVQGQRHLHQVPRT